MAIACLLICLLSCCSVNAGVQTLTEATTCSGIFFASFNIQNYGVSKASRSAVLEALAAVIIRYDIVVIQELSHKPDDTWVCGEYTESSICDLQTAVNAQGSRSYSLRASPRLGDEQFALFFERSKASFVDQATYPDTSGIHSRPPHAFLVRAGGKSLAIATTHTKPSDAKAEISDFPSISEWMHARFNADAFMIAGDFNADGSYFDEDSDWQGVLAAMPGYTLFTGNELDTTLASSSNTYDRIIASSCLQADPAAAYKVEDHVDLSAVLLQGCSDGYVPADVCSNEEWSEVAKELSDHYPVELCMHLESSSSTCSSSGNASATTSLGVTTTASKSTSLGPGACAVVGFSADNPDDVAVLLLVDLEDGERIYMTDNGVKNDGSLRRNEGVLSFTAQGITPTRGTVLRLADFATVEGSFALSSSGDQVVVFAGSPDSPIYLCALNSESSPGAWQSSADSSSSSALPPGLQEGVNALALDETDNAAYAGGRSGSPEELLKAINDAANWISDQSNAVTMPGNFVVAETTTSTASPTMTTSTTDASTTAAEDLPALVANSSSSRPVAVSSAASLTCVSTLLLCIFVVEF
eukprot:TRINITY_DN17313_c0_g1_i2.p1 TRINITY_DN17313_c0_g1~~TRINITY_DN17313_c0_g1_i2.p1  ORF type:complete len:585 (+),score=139.34 TRINITY_DN17313_c0_g1_i2:25-1779(+)